MTFFHWCVTSLGLKKRLYASQELQNQRWLAMIHKYENFLSATGYSAVCFRCVTGELPEGVNLKIKVKSVFVSPCVICKSLPDWHNLIDVVDFAKTFERPVAVHKAGNRYYVGYLAAVESDIPVFGTTDIVWQTPTNLNYQKIFASALKEVLQANGNPLDFFQYLLNLELEEFHEVLEEVRVPLQLVKGNHEPG